MRINKRYELVVNWFMQNMPVAETELNYTNPYQLLVAVVLSAQCTDKRVNLITPKFYETYPTTESLAVSNQEAVFEIIKSCSYPNNKAKHLVGAAKTIMDLFEGDIPDNLEDLQKIPGVGRKTANVILSVAFNKPAMAVDTHVHRVSARIGLTRNAKNPLETEKQLVDHIPEELLSIAHHWLILHGRYVCIARKPKCRECGLIEFCNYKSKILT
jgi:endonuclease-3